MDQAASSSAAPAPPAAPLIDLEGGNLAAHAALGSAAGEAEPRAEERSLAARLDRLHMQEVRYGA